MAKQKVVVPVETHSITISWSENEDTGKMMIDVDGEYTPAALKAMNMAVKACREDIKEKGDVTLRTRIQATFTMKATNIETDEEEVLCTVTGTSAKEQVAPLIKERTAETHKEWYWVKESKELI